MYCSNCGKKIKESSNFCTDCGVSNDVLKETDDSESTVTLREKTRSRIFKLQIVLIPVLLLIFAVFFFSNETGKQSLVDVEQEAELVPQEEAVNEVDGGYFNEEEMVAFTKEYLFVLQRLYYINQDDSSDADTVTGLIVSMTSEALKDKSSLENLLSRTAIMQESKIRGADLTGLVLHVSIMQLIQAHEEYIQFLREVDETTADLAEFQYQIAKFQSSTKTAYLSLAENTAIFPLTFLQLNNDPDRPGEWRISLSSRQEILNEIDLRFSDIFIEAENQYSLTQTKDTTVFIVQELQEFFETVQ